MGLLLFALYACSHYGASAPILRPRQDQTSSWHSEPNGRGTWGLLSSCVITMGICVWSAVHLNVPGRPPEGKWKRLSPRKWWHLSRNEKWERWSLWNHRLRRTRWTIMGLLAPELVVYCAWVQWSDARELSRRIARAKYPRKHPWTFAHSFLAEMGGFAVDSSDFVSGQDYLYLTTAGVHRIVELGHPLPDLHEGAISDKSKADSLGKILVCLQAGYMVFQVVGRLVARLPITLLEVNTLGHVLCALTMYAFWFHKPLSVADPIVLSEDWARPLLLLWFMNNGKKRLMQDDSSQMNQVQRYRELDLLMLFAHPDRREQVEKQFYISKGAPPKRTLQECSNLELLPQTQQSKHEAASEESRKSTDINLGLNTATRAHLIVQQDLPEDLDGLSDHRVLFYKHSDPSPVSSDDEILQRLGNSKLWDGLTHVYHCDKQDQIEGWWERWSDHIVPVVNVHIGFGQYETKKPVSPFTKSGGSAFIPQHIFLDSAGLRRWELAHRGLELDPDGPMFIARDSDAYKTETLFATRVSNWPSVKTGLISRSRTPAWIMAAVTALYGALHGLCWHSHFPSFAEKMLWRTSSIVIAGGPVTVTSLFYVFDRVERRLPAGIFDTLWGYMGVTTMVLCAVVYVGARLFILLEAFVSLRSLPAEAYQTPNWITWLPHL